MSDKKRLQDNFQTLEAIIINILIIQVMFPHFLKKCMHAYHFLLFSKQSNATNQSFGNSNYPFPNIFKVPHSHHQTTTR